MSIKIRKKPFATLLEVLIALSLTTIILTTLSYFYMQIDSMNRQAERLQVEAFKRRFLQYRLTQILPKTLAFKKKSSKELFYFYSTEFSEGLFLPGTQSLVFAYDNCVSLDSTFAAEVLARLYVDQEGRLSLGIWPIPKRWPENELPPMKKEILFEGVKMLSFQFFVPPDKGELKFLDQPSQISKKEAEPEAENKAEPPRGDWVPVWLKEYQQAPAIVRINITPVDSEVPLVYLFPLPNCQHPIIYDQ